MASNKFSYLFMFFPIKMLWALLFLSLSSYAQEQNLPINEFDTPYKAYYFSLSTDPSRVMAELEGTPLPENASNIQKSQYYGVLSQAYYALIYPDKALHFAQKSLTYIDQKKQPWLYHNLLLFEALAFELKGELNKGLVGVKKAFEWAKSNNSTSTYLLALYVTANFDTALHDYVGALNHAQEGYSLAPLSHESYKRDDFSILIAQIYDARKDYALAIPYYEEAEVTFRASEQLSTLSIILYGLGRAHYLIGNLDVGKKILEEALAISKSLEDVQGEAYALKHLASINILQNHYTLAQMQLLSAKDIFINAVNHKASVTTSISLATLALEQKNITMAAHYIHDAEQEIIRKNMPDIAIELDEIHAEILFQQGKYEESYKLLMLVYNDYKNYRNQQSTKQLHEMRVEYELTSKQLENEILSKQNHQQSHELDEHKNTNMLMLLTASFALTLSALMAILIYRSKAHRRSLEILATTDELTGLYNRRYILNHLKKQIAQAERYGSDLCVAMVDLDWFKQVNDDFGHSTGDEVLRSFSIFCQQNLRDSDVIGRIGGEEFLIILPHTNIKDAYAVMDKIRLNMINVTKKLDVYGLKVTISVGLCEWIEGDVSEDIMQFVDIALYQAKDNGRNQVSLCERDTD